MSARGKDDNSARGKDDNSARGKDDNSARGHVAARARGSVAARARGATAVLEVDRVTMRFGGIVANEEVSFSVREGEIYAIIGPNGAGKTTLFNAITGIYQPTEGHVRFMGQRVRRLATPWLFLRSALIGVATAIGATISLHVSVLWEQSIGANMIYGEGFAWGAGLRSFWQTLMSTVEGHGWIVPAVGFALGVGAHLALWFGARRTPDLISRAGIARTFQNIRLFGEMTLLENVLVGMHARLHTGYFTSLLRLPRYFTEKRRSIEKGMELLRFVGLEARAGEAAGSLPYGSQRRLEIARALASRPKLLLLDEPAAGMNPTETVDLMDLIRRIRGSSVTVVLIEHHMRVVMGVSDRIVVLNFGKRIAEGTPEEIRNNPECIEAYLGKEELG